MDLLGRRGLDGVVSYYSPNAYYLSGYTPAGMHSIHEANGNAAVVVSRREPEKAIVLIAEQYITYFTHQPTWIADIRPYTSGMSQLDLPVDRTLDRFVTADLRGSDWARRMRERYEDSLTVGVSRALRDLGLDRGRVGFDNLRLAHRLALEDLTVADGYDLLKAVRAIKTGPEVELLRQATALNEEAILRAVRDWVPGTTWHEVNHRYAVHVAELGGFSRDPSPMALANLQAGDPSAIPMQTMLEPDYVLEPGMQIGFDAHGVHQGYCWDGGKTWTVGGEPTPAGARSARAAAAAMAEILAAMRTGSSVAGLQAHGRAILHKHGAPRPESAMIFFHGLGLEHGDMEMPAGSGYLSGRRADWVMERGMVVAVHLYCPGDAYERHWIEDVGVVGDDGATPLFSWGFDPILGA
ncbi:MAG: M24 family metallopeptidase [Pseudonocardia sp.]